jgi:predicted GNAT family acetyltransferase
MSDSVEITVEETGSKGRYIGRVAGVADFGELTFSRASPTLVIVDHTDVPDSLRGKGVGAALARRVVADARAQGFKIVPLCPFFRSQYERHPEWADVIKQS